MWCVYTLLLREYLTGFSKRKRLRKAKAKLVKVKQEKKRRKELQIGVWYCCTNTWWLFIVCIWLEKRRIEGETEPLWTRRRLVCLVSVLDDIATFLVVLGIG